MLASNRQIWRARLAYLLISILIVYIAVLPLGVEPQSLSVPDLLFCVTIAWVMRRPETLPFSLIALVGLFADMVMGRPLGLWCLFLLLATEYFRGRETGKGIQMRLLEWLSVIVLFCAMLAGQWAVLKISLAPVPEMYDMAWHALFTGLSYPLVVATLYWIVNIRAPLPADKSRSLGRMA